MHNLAEFLRYVRIADTPGADDGSARNLLTRAAAGSNTGVPSDGGFLMTAELSKRLLARVYNIGALISRATEVPFSGRADTIFLPAFDETSRANGSRFGGVQAYWQPEAAQAIASKPRFGRLDRGRALGMMPRFSEPVTQ